MESIITKQVVVFTVVPNIQNYSDLLLNVGHNSENKKILMPELFIPLFLILGHELSFSWGGKYLFFPQVWENVGA